MLTMQSEFVLSLERSQSTVPSYVILHAKKYSAVDATREAAQAIADRKHEMSSN